MKVSVWITSYNQRELLAEAIDSVLAQTLSPHEIIVVDDASSDGSQEMIREYKQKYPDLINPIFHANNTGVTQVRIDAITAATGEYITYVDGDDLFMQDKLEREVHVLEDNPDIDIVYSNHDYINTEGELLRQWITDEKPPEGNVFLDTFTRRFPHRSLFKMEMVKLDKWREIGLHDNQLAILEDYDMRIRLTKHLRVKYCDAILSRIRLHGTGLSSARRDVYFQNLLHILEKNKVLLSDLPEYERRDAIRSVSNMIGNIGFVGAKQLLWAGDMHKAMGVLLRSIGLKVDAIIS